ncbi:MAG: hypothetical protein JNL90_14525 [Planctomycetes bacterium]|nr:hypothetical protein [Planctomycetota bacterium]
MLSRERAAGGALTLALAIGMVALLIGCGRAPAAESGTLPPTLAATGLYSDFAARTLADGVIAFSPQYPLWTDGATKRRWIALPPGTSIDASDPDHWRFPPGTRLWKEFAFERPIETRYLELGTDGEWRFASYQWAADGSAAPLAPECGVRGAATTPDGVRFDVPSRLDCLACHRGGADVVLGFGALQLSGDRDPLALHGGPLPDGALDLAELVRRGLVRGLPEWLLATPPRIAAASPRERAVLGYLHGNCAACHNASGPLAGLGMDLAASLREDATKRAAPPAALSTTVGVESRFALQDASLRIAPGAPEQSVLARRIASRHAAQQMPPLGTRVVDSHASQTIAEWIRADLVPAASR